MCVCVCAPRNGGTVQIQYSQPTQDSKKELTTRYDTNGTKWCGQNAGRSNRVTVVSQVEAPRKKKYLLGDDVEAIGIECWCETRVAVGDRGRALMFVCDSKCGRPCLVGRALGGCDLGAVHAPS